MKIPDKNHAIELLKRTSYYSLISGYKIPFKNKEQRYKRNVSIDDVYALYLFDEELRALMLKYILIIENHTKSLISYAFCEKYGELQTAYLNVNNYDYCASKQDGINKLVNKLKGIIDNAKDYVYLNYQKKRYHNVPLWAIMKALTIGSTSKMYSFLFQSMKQTICKEFPEVVDTQLERMIDVLSRFRNVCAHNERLFDFTYKKHVIDDTDVHRKLKIRKKDGLYSRGKNDLFSVIIIFYYLLDKEDFLACTNSLTQLIDKLTSETNKITRLQLLKYMGFPINWTNIIDFAKEK